ncbi:hypothetical protein ACSBR2_040037 [Camellia fascicularis]
MDTSNTTNLFHMDVAINNEENEFPDYDNNTVEMDSSGESVESEDSKDSPDSADSKDSEDSSAEQLRSSFIASDDDDVGLCHGMPDI